MSYIDLGDGQIRKIITENISADMDALGVKIYDSEDDTGLTAFTPITADATLATGVGKMGDFHVRLGNSSRVVIYDNTAASGTILFDTGTTGAAEVWVGMLPTRNINFGTGLYADITGTVTVSGSYRL